MRNNMKMQIINTGKGIVNSYIYPCHLGYVLVDTGYHNNFRHFLHILKSNNINIHDIKYLFLTHAHDDHAGFINEVLQQNGDITIVLSQEAFNTLTINNMAQADNATGIVAWISCKVMDISKNRDYLLFLNKRFINNTLIVDDDNRSEVSKLLEGEILKTSGHTDCSLSLLLPNGSMFIGDVAMNNFPSIKNIPLLISSKFELIASWQSIINSNVKMLYPGHGKPFEASHLKKNIKYLEKARLLKITNKN